MAVRALVFEDDGPIRALLVSILEGRGYEVVAFAEPLHCGVYEDGPCSCDDGMVCGDILISDVEMPNVDGLRLIREQLERGCRFQRENVAVMSGGWNAERLERAADLGVRIFRKPFTFRELSAWLEECERRIGDGRTLRDLEALYPRRDRDADAGDPRSERVTVAGKR